MATEQDDLLVGSPLQCFSGLIPGLPHKSLFFSPQGLIGNRNLTDTKEYTSFYGLWHDNKYNCIRMHQVATEHSVKAGTRVC